MSRIEYEVVDRVARLTLNRPEVHNAQDPELLVELDQAWTRAATDDGVGVILVRANGKHFSAGHDLRAPADKYVVEGKGAVETGYRWEQEHYLGFSRRWRDIPKPSIAAVQGACIAGALNVIWPCDLIVAAEDAFFSDPVVLFGICGVEYHAHSWELGARRAKEMLFTGRRISAAEAHQAGMVNKVVPTEDLDAAAMELAASIAKMDPWALAQAKRAVNQSLDVMGQYAALQSGFDIHWTGHANAMVRTGQPLLGGVDDVRTHDRGDRG